MKKAALTFLSMMVAVLITVSPVSAESINDANQSTIQSIQQDLLMYLQSLNPQTKEEAEHGIANYFNEHPVSEEVVTTYYAQQDQKTLLPENEGITTPAQDFIGYMEQNIAQRHFAEYNISDDVKIIFTNSPVYFIESIVTNQPNDL
ncbi:hypothetical protein [Paenibacillus campi]|uniref:hypothetical protein n=1 Tax=Paenibacillus campi TaxID=3106031 RepID=UPI002AFE8CC1|nr:hypothetical protein [Paenibacillus sp. SGZ-1009]